MQLKRKIYDRMSEWKRTSAGTSALLIEGARRVGKSYMVEEFARKEYESYILVDFGNISKDVRDLFENETSNLDLFYAKLSVFYGKALHGRNSVIIFDEVQQFPKARQLVKYLVADGRYDVIETGSLIRLKKNVKDIIIPSEEERLEMFPLDFEEFLWAMGDEATAPFLRQCFEQRIPLGQALHRKVMNDFRQYLLVGGMPQAVVKYMETKDFEAVDRVKRRILSLYRDDISKFASGNEDKIFAVFDGIPAQLTKKEKKYKLSTIRKSARTRNYEDTFHWLGEAMIVNNCYNSTDPSAGLNLSADYATRKCYLGDTGLLVTQTFIDRPYAENELYKAILFDRMSINQGMLMENVVAQMLRARGHRLFFYSRNDAVNRENHMEIDFLITKGQRVIPLEVKSANYRSHASLDKFCRKFQAQVGEAIILYTKDLQEKDGILHIPVYMAMCL